MNKRLEKRHKRQVARAKERVRISEPDVRTPEQIKAAREASRPAEITYNHREPASAPSNEDTQ
jgi:hypothetical protein